MVYRLTGTLAIGYDTASINDWPGAMIDISLKYYNIIADLLGRREERRQVPAGSTVGSLIEALAAENGSFHTFALDQDGRPRTHLRLFRNGQAVLDLDECLADADELRLFPTISGG